jgi:hypothetical protein
VKFSNADEFELHVHKCFNRMFELLMKIDSTVKQGAEQEEESGELGVMCNVRDSVEEIILQCHLAWQYHRLSKGPAGFDTWNHIEQQKNEEEN